MVHNVKRNPVQTEAQLGIKKLLLFAHPSPSIMLPFSVSTLKLCFPFTRIFAIVHWYFQDFADH